MRVVKLFMAAIVLIVLLDELIKENRWGSSREGIIKTGMLIVFEMWLLGG